RRVGANRRVRPAWDSVSRRRFLGAMAALGGAAGLADLAGCSPPAPAPAPAPTAAGGAAPAPAAASSPVSRPAMAPAAGRPKRGGSMTLTIHEYLSSNDPYKSNGTGDILVHGLISQPLIAGNAKDEIEPVLAESFRSEDGGKTWIFNLRKGVKFHNGRE